MARFAPTLPAAFSDVNFHAVVGAALFTFIIISLGAIAMFGRIDSALPFAKLEIPSLADSALVQAKLRPEDTNPQAPIISMSEYETEPSLNGVSDPSDKTSAQPPPVRTQTPTLPVSPHALAAVPFSGLTETGPGGLLPKIGADGQLPAIAYAKPFVREPGKPLVSLVVGGLGMMSKTTLAAIEELPPEVSLSFVPYTPDLQTWVTRARAAGHEVLIELPMEPFGYPDTDPGPYTLLSTASAAENTRRLEWLLSRTTGYFGVTNYMGSKLTSSENALGPVFRGLNKRGIHFLFDGETRRSSLRNVANAEGLTWTTADRIVDAKQTSTAIDDELLRLEAMAIQNGTAIGKGFSWPVTINQLRDWTASLQGKGYQLAPVSAVIQIRADEAKSAGGSTTSRASAARQ